MTIPSSRHVAHCRVRPLRHPLAFALLVAIAPPGAFADPVTLDATELDRVVVSGARTEPYAAGESASATGLVLSVRETPQSVSTIGRAQLEDFGLDNVNDALEQATGVNVERVETGRTYYTARGFDITNFQRDGLGIPLPYGVQNGDVDTAQFERVEILRGANGLMSGTGNPSATVNFVRKRPTAAGEGSARITLGSWDRQRLEGDVSVPLNTTGSLRGRVVGAWEKGDSYLDRHSLEKQLLYGVVETDLGESTRLTAGASHQRNDANSPLWGALPLYYTDGTPTDYDRSTSTAADWSYWDTTETRGFIELAHAFGRDWELRAAVNYERSTEDTQLFYVYGTPDRETGEGLFSYPSDYESRFNARQFDLRAAGPFVLGGREHDLVVGASRSESRMRDRSLYGDDIGTALPALERWDGRYPKPVFDLYPAGSDFDFNRTTVYATARWNLADRFKIITGASSARVHTAGESYDQQEVSDVSRTSPFVGAVWDLSSAYSAYASYAEIFAQQTELGLDGALVGPLLGSNAEIGLKGEWFDGGLNASAAVFRVRQDNRAESGGFDRATGRFYHVGADAVSRGIELDVAGRVGEHGSLSGGFTHLEIEDAQGERARTYVPRNMLRLSTVWTLPAMGGLRLGASLRWQDDTYREQNRVLDDGRPVVTRQDGYTVLGLMAGYRFGNGWDAVVNLDNLTDEKYIGSLYWADQGYYAAPRSVSLSIGYRF